jgi:predicted unusual protein kinase regulating ubiquinone biosynthesis (AarF/ABC1/UbiB family)
MPAPQSQFGRRKRRAADSPASKVMDLAELARGAVQEAPPSGPLDRVRYFRLAFFFARVFLSFIGWDLVLQRVPGFRTYVHTNRQARWKSHAQRFRRYAIEYGGVLIKLGQFLSIRVDILPEGMTKELRGLQDAVPAEALADVQAVIAAEFKRPVGEVFAWFKPEPEAAASLAQVHKARLVTGEEVVVKVQRPHIEQLVETDLAALRLAASWLKLYPPASRRVDLDRLYNEFSRTTRLELDFVQEGRNADRFAADFADDPSVYIADVFWEVTTRRVLTLENVASIKIDDLPAMQAAGISRAEVARKLYDTYLEQLFVHSFVHADPHPGNLFVHPLDPPADAPAPASRPFQLIFVDFGMVAIVPEALRTAMRDVAIAIGTRDAHRLVQAYFDTGVMLPGADRQRLDELHEVLFARLGGMRMGQLTDGAMQQIPFVLREYRDLLFEMPFQFPTDVLFAMRAVAILSGMATTLDPNFDPWAATLPFAERLASDQLSREWRGVLEEVGELVRLTLRLPSRMERFLTRAERGELVQQVALAPDTARALRRLERSVDRLTWGLVAIGLLGAGVLLRVSEGPAGLNTGLLIAAAVAFVWGLTRR